MNNRWRMKCRINSFDRIVRAGLVKINNNALYGSLPSPVVLTDIGINSMGNITNQFLDQMIIHFNQTHKADYLDAIYYGVKYRDEFEKKK